MPRPKKGLPHPNQPKRVTLQDIATIAGVHVMTVSDALKGTGRVAPQTRQKIHEIARELRYVPNEAARTLLTGQTRRIALFGGAYDQPYYGEMLQHLKVMVEASNYKLLLLRAPSEVEEMLCMGANTEVDGIITIDMFIFGDRFEEYASIPCVSIGAFERQAIDCVLVDLTEPVQRALDIMFESGRKRVAYVITNDLMGDPTLSRTKAYLDTAAKWGRAPEFINVRTDYSLRVRERFAEYAREHGCPDALFCQNDETAMSVYSVIRDMGLRIPEDVLLLGSDGHWHMDLFTPPLSTIVQPLYECCETAWNFLRQRIADPSLPHQRVTLKGKLKVTKSLG